MNRRINATWPFVALIALMLFALALAGGGFSQVSAAPPAAVTPVAAKNPTGGGTSIVVKFFDAESLTADTIRCKDLGDFLVADIEYIVDQTTTNTTTVSLLHTNMAAPTVYATGQTIVSANAADANDLNRFDLYGKYTCVKVDVTNSNAITWTVTALARK